MIDRRLKKWQGFFMPELVRALKNLEVEEQKIPMPLLDEYQLQEFEERIEERITGHVHYTDQLKRRLNTKTLEDQVAYVNFGEILDVKIVD